VAVEIGGQHRVDLGLVVDPAQVAELGDGASRQSRAGKAPCSASSTGQPFG
jgi:hypothetical protein